MEAQGDPLKGAPYPPNLHNPPRTSLHGNRRIGWRRFLALLGRRLSRREVFGWIGRCEGFAEYGFAPDLWVGCVGRVYAFRKCRLIPPHQSLTRQLPPKGKPSLHCANMANMVLHCGLPLRFALIALSCSAKRLLQKGFPSGGSCRVSD